MDPDQNGSQSPKEKVPPYDLELYERLKNADDKAQALNEWRQEHLGEIPNLCGAFLCSWDLSKAYFEYARLEGAALSDANLNGADLTDANLEGAILTEDEYVTGVHIPGFGFQPALIRLADAVRGQNILVGEFNRDPHSGMGVVYIEVLKILGFEAKNLQPNAQPDAALQIETRIAASLQGANLNGANLKQARLKGVKLEGANLSSANLEGADLEGAYLNGANLTDAYLKGANLKQTNLEGACLLSAYLEGAELVESDLRDVFAQFAVVDGETLLAIDLDRQINNETDFGNVGLDNARIEGRLKARLKHNIRRHHWRGYTYRFKQWFPDQNRVIDIPGKEIISSKGETRLNPMWPVMIVSDYGSSTTRLLLTFLSMSLLFAFLYLIPTIPAPQWAFWPTVDHPFVQGLDKYHEGDKSVVIPVGNRCLRALYFSIVTMTTLGFGDISAHPASAWGHILVMAQVVIGYVLLGALITRLAILFQEVE
ncbi:MAG: pentapeptide repeat-containing protein [Ktedonobacteraceae bacterium]